MSSQVSLNSQVSSDVYMIKKTNITISSTSLRIIRCTSAVFAVLGTLSLVVFKGAMSVPICIVVAGVTAVAIALLVASLLLVKKVVESDSGKHLFEQDKIPKGHRLYSTSDLNPNLTSLLDQLCEEGEEGKIKCPIEKLKDIVGQLKDANMLQFLDAIPACCYNNPQSSFFRMWNECSYFTPLHYWAKEGNLEAVEILIKNGAHDHFTEGENLYEITSGLYLAALFGHPKVVEYLLKNGSRADVAFGKNNVLQSFIPKLIFDIGQSWETHDGALDCLRLILSELKRKDPKNLEFQLRIPVESTLKNTLNAYDWLEWENSDDKQSQERKKLKLLQLLLVEFGADKVGLCTTEELRAKSYNVGAGFTLCRISKMK